MSYHQHYRDTLSAFAQIVPHDCLCDLQEEVITEGQNPSIGKRIFTQSFFIE